MSGETFQICPVWPDVMRYEESEERQIQFACRSLEEPPQVIVPAAQHWREQVPAWAHDRRELIVERLRGAGCLLAEVEGHVARLFAPDGSFEIEEEYFPPERAGDWEVLRIWSLPGRERLVQLPGYSMHGTPRFPRAGLLVLGIQSHFQHQRWQVQIDLVARSFRLQPQDAERPLAQLAAELERSAVPVVPPAPPVVAPPTLRARAGNALLVGGSLLFVAAGLWMTLRADNRQEFWTGVLSVIFFGGCAGVPLLDRRR